MSVLERVREQELIGGAAAAPAYSLRPAREQLKAGLVGRLGLDTLAAMAASSDGRRARAELGVAIDAILNSGVAGHLSDDERATVRAQVLDEVCGLGPIQSLLEDASVTEVMINGCDSLFFERAGEVHPAQATFDSAEQVMIVMDRILAPLGRRLDRTSPIVNARLPNGDRVNAVDASVALGGPAVTIRKFSAVIATLDQLVDLGALPAWYARLLSWAVRSRQGIAVAGGTGSGKTTLLNALSCEIGLNERIVTIEDSAELRFDTHPDVVRLEARDASIEGSGEVTIRDLVKNALRMRPDRIVVGEVRGGEAIDMLQAMNTGHDGSLTTLHAGTAQEAVLRLVLMARFGMDLPTDIIEEQISTALDLVVMSARLADGSRRITSLSEVGWDGRGVTLRECVAFDLASRSWELVGEPGFLSRSVESGVLDAGEVESWRRGCRS